MKEVKKEYWAYATNRRTKVVLVDSNIKATSSSQAMWNVRDVFVKKHQWIFVQIGEPRMEYKKKAPKKLAKKVPKIWCKLFTN